MRNVELALPEKARRSPRPVEPAAPPAAPVVAARAAPAPPRPAEPAAPPAAPVVAARAAPAPPRPAEPAAPPAVPVVAARAAPAPPRPAEPAAPVVAARAAPAPPRPAEPIPAQPPRPPSAPMPPAAVQPAVTPKELRPPGRGQHGGAQHRCLRGRDPKSPFRIGRAADNDGVLPVDATSGVSGHHCVITVADGRWYVQDDNSKFGTTVNGQPIPKGQPFKLEDGALLGLGPKLKIQFRDRVRLIAGHTFLDRRKGRNHGSSPTRRLRPAGPSFPGLCARKPSQRQAQHRQHQHARSRCWKAAATGSAKAPTPSTARCTRRSCRRCSGLMKALEMSSRRHTADRASRRGGGTSQCSQLFSASVGIYRRRRGR